MALPKSKKTPPKRSKSQEMMDDQDMPMKQKGKKKPMSKKKGC